MKKPQSIPKSDVPSVLGRHCLRSTPATVRPISSNAIFSVSFSSCASSQLKLDIQTATPGEFPNSGTCSVFFCHDGTGYHFIASILEPSTPTHVVLTTPTQITVERRSSLRVPINAGLGVQLKTNDGRVVDVRPRDLSLSGMLVEFPPNEDPGLRMDERIALKLRLASNSGLLEGWIRNQFGNNYGIAFSRAGTKIASDSLADLHRIYATLRQQKSSSNVMKTGARYAGTIVIPIPTS